MPEIKIKTSGGVEQSFELTEDEQKAGPLSLTVTKGGKEYYAALKLTPTTNLAVKLVTSEGNKKTYFVQQKISGFNDFIWGKYFNVFYPYQENKYTEDRTLVMPKGEYSCELKSYIINIDPPEESYRKVQLTSVFQKLTTMDEGSKISFQVQLSRMGSNYTSAYKIAWLVFVMTSKNVPCGFLAYNIETPTVSVYDNTTCRLETDITIRKRET